MMNIVVCIKQVSEEVRLNKKTGTLIREGIRGVINACDKHALELAVTLREKGDRITLITMGPLQVESSLP